jgi:prephenate dehydrogenase
MRIALIGTGLIGGSLALALRQRRREDVLVGCDRPEVLAAAMARNIFDEATDDPARAVAGCDLVVLATPIVATLRVLEQIAPHLAPGMLVTDTCSVKGPVVRRAAEVLPDGVVFVGGHPMAGAEHPGLEHADPLLFENATWVLTAPPMPDWEAAARPVLDLVSAAGARALVLDADRHDRIAAAVSHLPQLLASALVTTVADLNEEDPAFIQLAAGGFRDMTRIASSSFDLWREILAANEGAVMDVLARFAGELQRVRNRFLEEDIDELRPLFERAAEVRRRIPRDMKGFLEPLPDVMVGAEDRPGVLLGIVETLTRAGLDIKDIELMKIREGAGGTFRLSFRNREDADRAVETLRAAGHTAQIR